MHRPFSSLHSLPQSTHIRAHTQNTSSQDEGAEVSAFGPSGRSINSLGMFKNIQNIDMWCYSTVLFDPIRLHKLLSILHMFLYFSFSFATMQSMYPWNTVCVFVFVCDETMTRLCYGNRGALYPHELCICSCKIKRQRRAVTEIKTQ